MLDDEPSFVCLSTSSEYRMSRMLPSLSQFDIGLNGELYIAFLLFSCLEPGVNSVLEYISPGLSKPEDNPSV